MIKYRFTGNRKEGSSNFEQVENQLFAKEKGPLNLAFAKSLFLPSFLRGFGVT
jgi:hypothetical protein